MHETITSTTTTTTAITEDSRAERWKSTFDSWAGQDPNLASTGGFSNPAELAAVGCVLGDWLQLDRDQRALDVGCASGTLTRMWAQRASGVVGVDYSEALLKDARAQQVRCGDEIEFVNAEAAALPFADDSFDAVCCFGVLLCLPDHDYVTRAIDEILRVAKDDAHIVLGSLPDADLRDVFFDHCDARTPWYRRAIPREIRWMAKRLLKPGSRPGETDILWFSPEKMAAEFRNRGYDVRVEHDPEFSNYGDYRKGLVLSRRPGTAVEGTRS